MKMQNDLPQRKPTRLRKYDYSKKGVYFITICTQDRKNVLSQIVGEGSPLPKLTNIGIITDKWINRIHEYCNNYRVDCYVIMPNHIHLMLSINNNGRGDLSPTVYDVVGWMKYQITRDINANADAKLKIFQRSFHDHIIRNQDDFNKIYEYIRDNPKLWRLDRFYEE